MCIKIKNILFLVILVLFVFDLKAQNSYMYEITNAYGDADTLSACRNKIYGNDSSSCACSKARALLAEKWLDAAYKMIPQTTYRDSIMLIQTGSTNLDILKSEIQREIHRHLADSTKYLSELKWKDTYYDHLWD